MPYPYEPGSPDDAELRLACVHASANSGSPSLQLAQKIYEFVTGQSDASAIDRARAALDEISRGSSRAQSSGSRGSW